MGFVGSLIYKYNGSKMTGLIFRRSEGVLWALLYYNIIRVPK